MPRPRPRCVDLVPRAFAGKSSGDGGGQGAGEDGVEWTECGEGVFGRFGGSLYLCLAWVSGYAGLYASREDC
jgi:hypothetical protein